MEKLFRGSFLTWHYDNIEQQQLLQEEANDRQLVNKITNLISSKLEEMNTICVTVDLLQLLTCITHILFWALDERYVPKNTSESVDVIKEMQMFLNVVLENHLKIEDWQE